MEEGSEAEADVVVFRIGIGIASAAGPIAGGGGQSRQECLFCIWKKSPLLCP